LLIRLDRFMGGADRSNGFLERVDFATRRQYGREVGLTWRYN
jgi:hypothetical protein